jgi:acetyl esterase/lipase
LRTGRKSQFKGNEKLAGNTAHDDDALQFLREAFAGISTLNQFLVVMASHAEWHEGSLAQQREQFDRFGTIFAEHAGTNRGDLVSIGGVACELHAPASAGDDRVILYFHGGAYISGSTRSHSHLTSSLAAASGLKTISVEYRLAPEHPHPAALEDALSVYRHVVSDNPSARIALIGDSAGGGLATCMALEAARNSLPSPGCLVLFSPWLDLACTSPSCTEKAAEDVILNREILLQAGQDYGGGLALGDAKISPINDDLSYLPPLLVHVAGRDLLYDEQLRIVERGQETGQIAESQIWPDMVHGWQFMYPYVEEGRDSIQLAAQFIQKYLSE